MPTRREIFTNRNYYHIFNKTIDHKQPFADPSLCSLFLQTAQYYRSKYVEIPFSTLRKIQPSRAATILQNIRIQNTFQVSVVCFALMPNHYHFVLRQNSENGINMFMSQLSNSFTRFYNRSNHRKGPLFLPRFQSVAIMTNDQLLTVCRYVNRNPLAAGIVTKSQNRQFPWSSYRDYFSNTEPLLTETNIFLALMGNNIHTLQHYVEDEPDFIETLEYARQFELEQIRMRGVEKSFPTI